MTQTCKSCHEDPDICDRVGQDWRACEHHVGLSDVEPEPVVEAASSPTVECPFHDQCNEIITRLRKVERAVCDIGRAAKGELL